MRADKSVLIFGASGFVGSYLAKEFRDNGYTVYGSDIRDAVSNEYIDGYRKGDLSDSERVACICREFQPGNIVNLAAISSVGQSWRMPQAVVSVNVNGTLNIFDAAKELESQPKILIIGSSEEYAPSAKPLKETDRIDANNPYGISKMAQERFAEIYEHRYGLKIYRTRSFNHTGVGQSTVFVLPNWCKQIAEIEASGKSGILKVGNVEVERDFGDVRDVVRAYRLLLESDCAREVFNVGSGRALRLRTIAEHIASFTEQRVTIEVDPELLRPSDNPIICCDRSKAKEKLGWEPQHRIEDTLMEMYESFLRGRS